MTRPHVDPARALAIWNGSQQSLEQIADRFVGVTARNVRDSIEAAVAARLGDLRRPLPEKGAPRQPAVRIPKNIPRAAAFNPVVEGILENKPAVCNMRELTRQQDTSIAEMVEEFLAAGHAEWDGTMYGAPYITPERIKRSLLRKGRKDLWEKLDAALSRWKKLNGIPTGKRDHHDTRPGAISYSLPTAVVLRLAGLTTGQIGALLGVSGSTIAADLRETGLSFPGPRFKRNGPEPFPLACAVVARLGGLDWQQIAAKLGVREYRIRKALAAAGLEVSAA